MHQGYELPKRLNGFPRVAEKLASDPDKTTTTLRPAAELAELEAEQDRLDQEDKDSTSGERFDDPYDPYDLVALRVPADQDRLSEFILNYFGGFFLATSTDARSSYIRESTLAKTIAIISSILFAILLFGSIAPLYFVHNGLALFGMLGGWTVLFAVCVGWLTNARRDQISAATAAYCAVLVVFVSGTLGGAGSGGWNCINSQLYTIHLQTLRRQV
ncbi:hypothetical protein VC83_00645 [Pseudogymnoascus destructans]|uniref:DUF6594 domain-containing protein n=1 Tax=Pseudogymnoascus destructans TaxID=655981 RepID=A0A177ANR0_9PEZI|nr:uncharacterized protein VC83_00645 [Pseudogymnoascus destructans]OAF63480.1 hypothetical protein VC83_00645 [Pseudogymnoascus destructans]